MYHSPSRPSDNVGGLDAALFDFVADRWIFHVSNVADSFVEFLKRLREVAQPLWAGVTIDDEMSATDAMRQRSPIEN